MTAAKDGLIGTSEAAEILGWSQRRVQRAASTGAIPIIGAINHGQHLVLEKEAIVQLAEQQKGDEPEQEGEQPDTP